MIELLTERLRLRRLRIEDAPLLRPILQDPEVMYAWEHSFSDAEIEEWLLENLRRYETDGYSYMAVFSKDGGELLGVSGLLTEQVNGRPFLGIGWIYGKRFWKQGFAREGAKALLHFAFETLRAARVIATIRPENTPSRRLAERLNMHLNGSFTKVYKGKNMEHLIYEAENHPHRF